MGYDLHITRATDWAESETRPITAAEWLALVKADDDLTITGVFGDYQAVWNGESEHAEPWLDWQDGRIFTKNPDEPLIEKMVAIAALLQATVQGDDGEIYLGGGQIDYRKDPAPGDDKDFASRIKRLFGK